MRSKILVAAAVVALGFFAIASGPALAAPGGKGGKGGGKPGGSTTSAVITVSPNPVPVGTIFTATGTGFTAQANSWVGVGVYGQMATYAAWVDSTGKFTFNYPTALTVCGSYKFMAFLSSGNVSAPFNVTGC